MRITKGDREKYPLKEKKDVEILEKCKLLETKELSGQDRQIIELVKSQLLDDWRTPLIKELDELIRKY